ncbi:MAG: hypothetical protein GY754_06330 [bacterium]|nr:hypothetical protein [bacterium]
METTKKMKTVECGNCGAHVPLTNSLCKYCKTPIDTGHKLTDADKEKLTAVINSMEEALKASEGLEWIGGVSFILLAGLAVGLFILFNRIFSSLPAVVGLSVFTGIVLFCFFGFIIALSQSHGYRKAYDNDLRLRINEYLENRNFTRYQFDTLAEEVLGKKAVLRRFLFKN